MKAGIFVLLAKARPFFLSSLSESHNSIFHLLGMNKYSGIIETENVYLRISLSITAVEARRDKTTFGSVFRWCPCSKD